MPKNQYFGARLTFLVTYPATLLRMILLSIVVYLVTRALFWSKSPVKASPYVFKSLNEMVLILDGLMFPMLIPLLFDLNSPYFYFDSDRRCRFFGKCD